MTLPPILARSLAAQLRRPSWDAEQGVGGNLLANAQNVLRRGQDFVAGSRALEDMGTQGQAAQLQRMKEFLAKGDPVVKDPVDKLFFTRMLW